MRVRVVWVASLASLVSAIPAGLSKSSSNNIVPGTTSLSVDDAAPVAGDSTPAVQPRDVGHGYTKRAAIEDNCNREEAQTLTRIIGFCGSLAKEAADSATKNPEKMQEFFRDSSPQTARSVKMVFTKIQHACTVARNSPIKFSCDARDRRIRCQPGVLVDTMTTSSTVLFCPLFFRDDQGVPTLPDVSNDCHGMSRTTVFIHELTQIPRIKGTYDYDTFGYEALQNLDPPSRLWHSGTYELFAQASFISYYNANC